MRFSLLSFFLLTSCSVLDPSLLDQLDAGRDAGPDASSDTEASDTSSGCMGDAFMLPEPPNSNVNGTGELVLLGLHDTRIDLVDDERWKTAGVNLDGVCSTAMNRLRSCAPRTSAGSPVDGQGGIDNVFANQFMSFLGLTVPGLAEQVRTSSNNGTGGIIVAIEGWDRSPNDSDVLIGLTQSVYGIGGTATDERPPAHDVRGSRAYRPGTNDRMPTPTWDGNDWLFPQDNGFDSSGSFIVGGLGYVSNGVLVARLIDQLRFADEAQLHFLTDRSGIPIKISDIYLIIDLNEESPNANTATIAGRWQVADARTAASSLNICGGTTEFSQLTTELDKLADVTFEFDGTMGDSCDALSLGVLFATAPIRMADPVPSVVSPNQCERACNSDENCGGRSCSPLTWTCGGAPGSVAVCAACTSSRECENGAACVVASEGNTEGVCMRVRSNNTCPSGTTALNTFGPDNLPIDVCDPGCP